MIEPATGYPYNRKIKRSAGRVPRLVPGKRYLSLNGEKSLVEAASLR